ncbi:MAG: hypothetical protein PHQ01_01345 [Candidatus Pacebacteria bacterium]|nr:hypothetical protein [Candidatus Paceibacterota bacterium]
MRRYKEKFIWQNIFYSNFTIVVSIVLIVLLGRGILGVYKKFQVTKADYIHVSKEVDEAERVLEMNELKLENINTKEGEERYIRETYPVKKAEENVVVVYSAPASTYEIPKNDSKWEVFKVFLKNLFKR